MADLKNDKVLFALTSKGYEDIASNLSAVRAYIQQQRQVIILYEKVWDE
jgi:predicted transcriptional regulator|tara:strand:- start:7101 stop:7247 length:147 start_codon:yes stop_codon:yes gene_type:complete